MCVTYVARHVTDRRFCVISAPQLARNRIVPTIYGRRRAIVNIDARWIVLSRRRQREPRRPVQSLDV